MITCKRVCWFCLAVNTRWRPFTTFEKWRYPLGIPFSDPELGPTVMARPGGYGMPKKCVCSGTSCPVVGHRCWDINGRHAPFLDAEHYRRKYGAQTTPWCIPFGAQFFVSVRVQLANGERDGLRERAYCRTYLDIMERVRVGSSQWAAPGYAWGVNQLDSIYYPNYLLASPAWSQNRVAGPL